jgi:hypothetical protein
MNYELEKWTITALRQQLESLKLDSAGTKDDLIERLLESPAFAALKGPFYANWTVQARSCMLPLLAPFRRSYNTVNTYTFNCE